MSEVEERQKKLAMLSVSQATHACAHLMELANEGAQGAHTVFSEEVIELLADGLRMAWA